jgi:hypothetical protein
MAPTVRAHEKLLNPDSGQGKATRQGLERVEDSSGNTPISLPAGTESGTVGGREAGLTAPLASDLARVVDAWPTLPEATRQAVLRLIGDGNTSANGADTLKPRSGGPAAVQVGSHPKAAHRTRRKPLHDEAADAT